jgi:AcrR family transcriptional regulator
MVETDRKREQIVEGAIKRFIHFGVNKTTMNEIAEDLSVSKPALYYYFPDKTSLIVGVVDKIFNDFFEVIKKEVDNGLTLEKTLINLIEVGNRYFQKYYMLHLSGGSPDSFLNSVPVHSHIVEMKKKNLALHAEIFQKAAERGEIEADDVDKMADLYLYSMAGITSLCIMQGNKDLIPGKKEFKNTLDKQINLCKIFLKGIKSNTKSNQNED